MNDDTAAVPTLPDWQKLMDTLFPAGKHVMRDVGGTEYPVRTTLAARREVELVRKLAEVSQLPAASWAQELAAGAADKSVQGTIGALLGVVGKLAAEPRVLDLLCEAVAIAHPALLAQAVEANRSTGLLDGVITPGLADLFDTTELVQSLLPFVLRPASKAMGALNLLPLRPTT